MKISLGAKTAAYPTPVFVVGTYDASGAPNVMTVAWGGVCCSDPPCLSIAVRKATYTYSNLVERRAFTVSIPSVEHVEAADYFGIASGRDTDKLSVAGLTAVGSELVDAPYLAEFPLALECKVVNVTDLGLHTQFVGEIVDVKAEEHCLDGSGRLSAELLQPFSWAPLDNHYYALGRQVGRGFSAGKVLKDKGA